MDVSLLEGFKLRQCPVDSWTTREHLCLTSAVSQTGDQNWVAVSRAVRQLTTEAQRPPDWYSTKNCALQYGRLLEQMDAPRRKREKGELLANTTPEQILLKMLTEKWIEELKGHLEEEKTMYNQLKKEINHLESNQLDNRLHQYWDELMREQEAEDSEAEKQKKFFKEREEKIRLNQAASKLQLSKGLSPIPKKSSIQPVLSSSITEDSVHDYAKKEPESPKIEMLENASNTFSAASSKTVLPPMSSLKSSSSTSSQDSSTNSISMPESSSHNSQTSLKTSIVKIEEDSPIVEKDFSLPLKGQEAEKLPEESFEEIKCESSFESNMPLDYTSNLNAELKDDVHEISPEEEKKLLETTDLNDLNIKEEVIKIEKDIEDRQDDSIAEEIQESENNIEDDHREEDEESQSNKSTERSGDADERNEEEILNESSLDEQEEKEQEDEIRSDNKDDDKHKNKKIPEECKSSKLAEEEVVGSVTATRNEFMEKLDETESKKTPSGPLPAEWSLPSSEAPLEKEAEKKIFRREIKDEYEFDDDASRESTDVKEYMSRSDRRKISLSENVSSPVVSESTPSSPASTSYGDDPEAEKSHRSWKRSIMLIWNDIAAHKNASLFLKPITEDKVPGYHSIVFKPIDLMTIKRNIESGSIRTTAEFQRDIMLMFLNAKMYNPRNNNIHRMANHMMNDAIETIEEFIHAQMLAKVVETPQKNLRRETRESSAKRGEDKRKREEREEKILKRRKI